MLRGLLTFERLTGGKCASSDKRYITRRYYPLISLLSATTMPYAFTLNPGKKAPAPAWPAVGCAHCWAAKYCASFSALASPQPPPNCPLVPRRAKR